ncbi:cytochrome c-type biogenesis protein [Vibrio agarivorans]|uniref:cytochrome c-type biogenesis protein n=2 Tax=Vibrio agarivorans TaxID=153622 RepID=UPI0025B31258|nr:cytochrome c-type biogenesis protein [Vibrio agarivorans]MDN3660334.1 cytochrome c-type biogenesis protein CcmH [Vibrio agarivorans]
MRLRLSQAVLLSATLLIVSMSLWAYEQTSNSEVFEFESHQQRALAISIASELRCAECENENLTESNKPAAQALKLQVFSLVKEGFTGDEIKQKLVAEYGQQVLYQPESSAFPLILWGIPILASLVVAGFCLRVFRQRKRAAR